MKLKIWEKRIELKDLFTVSREAYAYKRCLIIGLAYKGCVGYGEATEFQVYGSDIELMTKDLEKVAVLLKDYEFTSPSTLWEFCYKHLHQNSFAQSALDLAAYDLWGKLREKPVRELLGIKQDYYPKSSISLPIDTLEKQIERVKYYKDWPIMKIKVASESDIDKMKTLRLYTDAVFRVDANCGWTLDESVTFSKRLLDCGVDLIEQPLAIDDFDSMKILKKESAIPLVADESFRGKEYIDKCAAGFHAVNLKLMKVGGITPAVAIINECKSKGLKVMIGCMPESSIGVSAIALLSPFADYVDMDSIELIAHDFARGATLENGEICLTNDPGLGFSIDEEFRMN